MGERRLALMEAMLPDDAWVLGVDEHTAVIMDLDAGTVSITGRGALTVRRRGASRSFAAGEQLDLDTLKALARGETSAPKRGAVASTSTEASAAAPAAGAAPKERSPLLSEANRLEQTFGSALSGRKAGEAAEAILHLDRTIQEWAADSLQSDEPERARAILHSLVHRLGEAAAAGVRDPREQAGPPRREPHHAAAQGAARGQGLGAGRPRARPPDRRAHRGTRHAGRHGVGSARVAMPRTTPRIHRGPARRNPAPRHARTQPRRRPFREGSRRDRRRRLHLRLPAGHDGDDPAGDDQRGRARRARTPRWASSLNCASTPTPSSGTSPPPTPTRSTRPPGSTSPRSRTSSACPTRTAATS